MNIMLGNINDLLNGNAWTKHISTAF
jgi:hypothetical protein